MCEQIVILLFFCLFVHLRYSIFEDFTEPPLPTTTYPATSTPGPFVSSSSSFSSSGNSGNNLTGTTTPQNSNTIPYGNANGTTSKPITRKGGIIFPSVKNKPSVVNSSFATDALSYKDVKVC